MNMDQDLIIELYRKAAENGNGSKQIKALAKSYGVDPAEIRKILNDAGVYIPRQKPEPKPKRVRNMSEAAADQKPADHEESQPAAGCQAQENKTKISPVIKECIVRGIEDMELKLQKGKEEISAKIKEMQDLEALYLRAKFEYAGMVLEGKINVDTTGSETGQSSEQACDNNLL